MNKRDSTLSTAKAFSDLREYVDTRRGLVSERAERREALAREIAEHQTKVEHHQKQIEQLTSNMRAL